MTEDIKTTIDGVLDELGRRTVQLAALQEQAEAEIAAVREKYGARVGRISDEIKALDKEVKSLAKNNIEIFDGKDQITLPHGILLHGKEKKVIIPKGALEKIEAQGWDEAIKIAKSIDRAVVEKWPVEKLVMIGAKRRTVETFNYELKGFRQD